MVNIIVELSKYILIILIALYTYQCFSVFAVRTEKKQNKIYRRQNRIMFILHFIAYVVLCIQTGEVKMLIFYGAQVILFILTIQLYQWFYPKVSRLVVNNMCMLLCIGFIILARLSYDKAVKQFMIVAAAMVFTMLVPIIIRKMRFLNKLTYLYAVGGIGLLLLVSVAGNLEYGAKMAFNFGGFTLQPAEFVKIIFVFFVAGMLSKSTKFRQVVIATMIAGIHVLVLVASKDLGAALIFFVAYLVMLYVATKKVLYLFGGLLAGSGAAVMAYHIFDHVKTRVVIWRDPFEAYDSGGGQVAQALFAIAAGSWFGTGLYQGSPTKIPIVVQDFIFAAIAEEMGLIFGLCLILICVSCFIMFLNIAMQIKEMFYKLIALGLGTIYIFQVFLTIGGSTKFIPLTGVTLPLVSYGGSSVVSTLVMFGIIQGLYILREDEDEIIERQKAKQEQKNAKQNRRKRIQTAKTGKKA